MIINGIKIQNIYYMLVYSFSVLKSNGYEKLASEKFDNTLELLGAILSKGVAIQVKRGLGKDYIPISENLSTLRGKIEITESIKNRTMLKKQLNCSYDEFSVNTKLNQIIKSTLLLLLRENINSSVKKDLKKMSVYFKDVDEIDLYNVDWNMRFHRNNQSYQMLISICYLIIKGHLQKDSKGDMRIQKFMDEQRMATLYEKFILEYYKKHFPYMKVAASQIKWDIEDDNSYVAFLPKMQSDIMISTKNEDRVLIIDAKFYTKSMTKSHYGNKNTFHSNNLYQIYTYVKNKDSQNKGNVSGMLLYAKTDEEITPNAHFLMGNNKIYVKSLDLSQEFENIQKSLNSIVDNFLIEN